MTIMIVWTIKMEEVLILIRFNRKFIRLFKQLHRALNRITSVVTKINKPHYKILIHLVT